jgi:hypothetical protein
MQMFWVPGHFAERHFAEWTFCQTDILPNRHFADGRLLNGYFAERTL